VRVRPVENRDVADAIDQERAAPFDKVRYCCISGRTIYGPNPDLHQFMVAQSAAKFLQDGGCHACSSDMHAWFQRVGEASQMSLLTLGEAHGVNCTAGG